MFLWMYVGLGVDNVILHVPGENFKKIEREFNTPSTCPGLMALEWIMALF